MNLASILFFMMVAVIAAKKSKKFGKREYLIAFVLALLQMGVTVYRMMTMTKPPLF